jgi:hypothetical protein
VEGTGGGSLGTALLSKLDRFNRSIDSLTPLMATLSSATGSRIDATKVVRARDEMQAAASDLSTALLSQIDSALDDRLSSLSLRRLLAVGTLVVPLLLGLAPVGLALSARRRGRTATAPAAPPPPPWPAEPVQLPRPGHHDAAGPEYARWERFGAPQ